MSFRRLGALFGILLVGSGFVPGFPYVAADRSLVPPESTVSEDEGRGGGERHKNDNDGWDLRKGMHDHGLMRAQSGDVGAGAHSAQVDDKLLRSVYRTEDEGDADATASSSATMFDMNEDGDAEEGPELGTETHHRLRGGNGDAAPKEDNFIDNGEEGQFSSLPSTLPFLESEDSQMEPPQSADGRELYVCSQFYSPSCPDGCVPSGVNGGRCVDPENRFVNNQYYGGNRFVNNQQYGVRGGNCGAYFWPNCPARCASSGVIGGRCVNPGNRFVNNQQYGVRGGNCGAYFWPNCPVGCVSSGVNGGRCIDAGNRFVNNQQYYGVRGRNCGAYFWPNCPVGCERAANGFNDCVLAGTGNRFGNAQYYRGGSCSQFGCGLGCPTGCACGVNGRCVANNRGGVVGGTAVVVNGSSTYCRNASCGNCPDGCFGGCVDGKCTATGSTASAVNGGPFLCINAPCQSNGDCVTTFTDEGYCATCDFSVSSDAGFTGRCRV